MRRIFVTTALATLVLLLATTTGFAQVYPNFPYAYRPATVEVRAVAPATPVVYTPSYYLAPAAVPSAYGWNSGYIAPGRSYYYAPSPVAAVPTQPVAPPAMPYAENVNRSYYRAAPAASPPNNRAAIDVIAPLEAKLWFQGRPTQQRGDYRNFVSPPLDAGKTYTYEVRALWLDDNGGKVEWKRQIPVRAGELVTLDLRRPGR